MKTKPNLQVTEAESEYRTKHYHDFRVLKQRDSSCASCGNILSHRSGEIFSHPIFHVLQCRKCNDCVKSTLGSDSVVSCRICAIARKNLYECGKKNCGYKFCHACIKRNAPRVLSDAESKNWKCFVCNLQPLWKLRGACAAIMSSTSKRTKRKKVSRNKSSDTDDEKSSVKNVSYVRKRRRAEAEKMSKRLSTFCDEESPAQKSNTWGPTLDENTRRTKQHLNITDPLENRHASEKTLTVITTSGDSDIGESMSNGCRDTSKSRKNNSPTRRKGVKNVKKVSRSQDRHDRKTWTNTNKLHSKVSSSNRNVSISSSDSDDDDIEMLKRPALPSYSRKKSKSHVKPSEGKRKPLHDKDSNDEEKVATDESRKVAVATFPRKSVKLSKDDKRRMKNYKPADEEDTDIDNYSGKPSKQNGAPKRSIINDDGRSRKSTRDKVKSQNLNPGVGDDSSEKNRDSDERIDERSGKSFHLGRVRGQTAASDSSSSKEFRKSKLFRNSYVSLKRISELDEDYTKRPEDSPKSPEDLITKDQTFALKNSVTYFFAELRKAATKLVNDIEYAQAKYCMKDSMRPMDADRLILETKNVVTTLKKCVDRGENKMDDYYEKWCKRTRVRNILKTEKTSDDKTSEKKLSIEKKHGENESDTSLRRVSSSGRNIGTESLAQSINMNGATECIMVSDCNSEEIFSNGETEDVTRKSCSISPCTINRKKSSSPDMAKTSREDDNVSSEDTDEKNTACPNTKDKLGEKSSIVSCNHPSDRDSVDPSDVDIFESTIESPDDDTIEAKTSRKNYNSEVESSERKISRTTDKESRRICNSQAEQQTDKNHSDIGSSDDEEFSKKSAIEMNDKNNETSPNVEHDIVDLAINESGKSAPEKIIIDEISTKKDESRDDDSTNNSIIIPDSTNDRSSKLSLTDQNFHNNTVPSTKCPLNVETSGDARDRVEIEINCEVEKAARNNEENSGESIYSLETVDGGNNDDIIESCSKSPSVVDDNEIPSSLDTVLNVVENNDAVVERGNSESSGHDDFEKLVSSETVVGENNFEKEASKSPERDDCERRSSLDTVIVENIAQDIEKTGSNSPIVDEERYSSNGETNDDKYVSESKEVDNMGSCCSVNIVFAEDHVKMPVEKSSKSNLSPSSTSSTPSETDELRVRDMLLMSSNSDDSSVEDSLTLENSGRIESDNQSPTSSKSNDSSKSTRKDTSEIEFENKHQHTRIKRNKFRIEDNPRLMADEQLNRRCEISLMRLEKEILDRHSRILKQSRDYVESIKLKRLVALDKLDKKKKSNISSDSENEDTSCSKDLKNKRKSRATKEREETLLDHLEKVKNGKNIEPSDQSDSEQSDKEEESVNKSGDLFAEADRMAKKRLLESSDSAEDGPSPSEPQEAGNEEQGEKTKRAKTVEKKAKLEKLSENEDEKREKSDKGRWRKNKILTLRISDTDSEEEKKTFESSQDKLSERKKNEESHSDSAEENTPKKKRVRRRVLHSDSDVEISPPSESESSDDSINQKQKKKKNKDSSDDDAKKKTRKRIRREESGASSSDSLEQKRPKTRRKRIKKAASDSDSDIDTTQGTPGKSGRKNIRKVIRDKQVADDTKQAAKDEEERLQRIAERQKLYNQMYENRLAGEKKVDKLVLDFDETTKEPLVSVDEALVKRLKPHQAQGIKFMWDACFESLERTKSTKGSGCILAHCMGLGKTFQIVALSHTLLQHEETGIKTIMVVCPLSTVLNWVNEFKIWLENLPDGDDIEVYELTRMKKNFERKYQLQRWQKTGGVMIIGYEMFRNLSNTGKKVRKNIQEVFSKSLVDPGPDLIVCDEGHLLKNEDTALSKAMRRVRTLRRIVLTGTPLQNNLIEYHCMVQFVKPNLLGTKKEFTNRFESPITNGQFDDSTEYDVRLMKKRAHVLHKMLEGSVQRLDYSVLTPFLPPKQEYVIFVKLTEIQIKMYRHYLDNYARRHRGVGGSLFADFQALQRIWTHPLVMQMNAKKIELANEKKRLDATDSEGSLCDFIDDGSDSDSSDSSDVRSASGTDDDSSRQKPKRGTRANPLQDEPLVQGITIDKTDDGNNVDYEWWTQFVEEEDYEDMRISSKLLMLFAILKESHSIGDKVLVFSQSLYSLTLIEEFLRMIDDATHNGNDESDNLGKHTGSWSLGLDYFRLDGQTTTDNRRRWCDIFNRPTNTRARLFLISTRAGGLGINLTAANRVIIFDASWNPSHDVQSIFRIYRFGQKKPCYVYRLLAAGTMEEKIYNRQVTKLSLSCRVVDEQQIERHYSNNALAELYKLEISETEHTHNLPKDRLLADILLQYKHCVDNYHEHDSLLENQAGEELDDEERQQAWLEYEEEKKGKRLLPPNPFMTYQNELLMQQMNLINMAQSNPAITNPAMMLDYENIKQMMSKDFPGVSEAQQQAMATRTVYEMYNYVERQALAHQTPMGMMNMASGAAIPPFENRIAPQNSSSHPTPEMIRLYQQSLVQQQNGQINYPINHGIMADSMGHARNQPIGSQMQQLSSQTAPSAMSSAAVDDDIVEIPPSPEKSLVPPTPAPGGSRKSQEE